MTWNASNSFHENNLTYDLNGNIESLSRKGAGGANLDELTYDYGTGAARSNRLLKVTDAGDPTKGFVDGLNSGNDYAYDANGNMTYDLNKKIGTSLTDNTSKITYNHLNLPEKIQKDNGEKMVNIYDATGKKLSQVVYDTAGVVSKRIDYVGEFYYQNDTLQFISHEEGRVVPQDGSMVYEYNLKDHLGNVRITFTTQPKTDTFTAGFEDAQIADEQGDFHPSYDDAVKVSAPLYNHTLGGNKSQRLSAANENEIIGLARSLDVVPGDTIHMEVYAKYTSPATGSTNIAGNILAALSGAFGLSPSSTGIGELAYQSLVAMNNLGLLINTGPDVDETKPKAYLNYILFDEDFVAYDFGFKQVTDGLENGSGVPHQKLELTAVARKPGYVYIYLSNENGVIVDVYFDDLLIEYKHSPVLEETFYYPFGMVAENYQKQEIIRQPFKYNGKEEVEFTNWLDYGARMYQPDIARFSTPDRYTEKYFDLNPYQYGANNPMLYVDINGDSIKVVFQDKDGNRVNSVPTEVQQMFNLEFGIKVGYNAETEMLYYGGDYESELSQSETATNLLKDKLTDTNTGYEHGEITFGYNLRGKTGEVYLGASEKAWLQGEGVINKNYVDLADFNSNGMPKGWKTHGMSARDENVARIFEHEYLGHHQLDKMGGGDGTRNRMGKVVEYTNQFRRERGLLEQFNYGAAGTKIIFGRTSDFNSKRELMQYIRSVNNGKITPKSYMDK